MSKTMEIIWKLLPSICKLARWFTKRKPTRGVCLIVEDNAYDAEYLQIKLRKKGWESEIAASGDVAAGLVKHQHYPIVFVDMRLPGMSGAALLRILSRDAPHSNVIVVCGEPTDMKEVPKGIFVGYIGKPAELEAVEDMLERLRVQSV